jgi:hypothetical protein
MTSEYRAYSIGDDGHFYSAEVVIAENDEAAIEAAQKLVDGHDVELWQFDRKITVLKSQKTRR